MAENLLWGVKKNIKNWPKLPTLRKVRDKLLEADEVYVIYSQLTGEPYMFSKTYDRG